MTAETAFRGYALLVNLVASGVFLVLLYQSCRALDVVRAYGITDGREIVARSAVRSRAVFLLWSAVQVPSMAMGLFLDRRDWPDAFAAFVLFLFCLAPSVSLCFGLMAHRDSRRLLELMGSKKGGDHAAA